jgi:hypothetical protein
MKCARSHTSVWGHFLLTSFFTISMASYAQTQQPSQLPTLTKSDPVSSILPDGTVIKLRFAALVSG